MKKLNPFQVVILGLFIAAIVGGVIVLATTKSKNRGSGIHVVIWGTVAQESFNYATEEITRGTDGYKITYIEQRPENFDQKLIEALASGSGPDAIILPQDLILRYRDKISPIPYSAVPLRTFKDSFIEESELFLHPLGILAMPFSVDPLVMYWNRDILTNAGIANPPQFWDEFIALAKNLTVKDQSLNIIKSAVALGEYSNITNAKEIIATLFLQAGNPITNLDNNGLLVSTLYPATLSSIGAINFYTDFANPIKPDYSWNLSLPSSLDFFIAGDLAFYFGFASEISKIRDKNPNLNFDMSYFPQPRKASVLITFGRMQGIALLASSRNWQDAFAAVLAITSSKNPIARWSINTGLPPVRRGVLSANPSDPYQEILYNSALRSRAWLDPNPLRSKTIFQDMIEFVTSGQFEVGRAIETAGKNLTNAAKGI